MKNSIQLEIWLRDVAATAAEEAGRLREDTRLARVLEDLSGRAEGIADAVEQRRVSSNATT